MPRSPASWPGWPQVRTASTTWTPCVTVRYGPCSAESVRPQRRGHSHEPSLTVTRSSSTPCTADSSAGFLVAADLVCTCAHVVEEALDLPAPVDEAPGGPVNLDFPLLSARPSARASVVSWRHGRADVALLRLDRPAEGARPVGPVDGAEVWGHRSVRSDTRTVGITESGCGAPCALAWRRGSSRWRRTCPGPASRKGSAGPRCGTTSRAGSSA
ncbi:trypsin-like peptidase domain-containing protein [Streptomyces sparsogenes]